MITSQVVIQTYCCKFKMYSVLLLAPSNWLPLSLHIPIASSTILTVDIIRSWGLLFVFGELGRRPNSGGKASDRRGIRTSKSCLSLESSSLGSVFAPREGLLHLLGEQRAFSKVKPVVSHRDSFLVGLCGHRDSLLVGLRGEWYCSLKSWWMGRWWVAGDGEQQLVVSNSSSEISLQLLQPASYAATNWSSEGTLALSSWISMDWCGSSSRSVMNMVNKDMVVVVVVVSGCAFIISVGAFYDRKKEHVGWTTMSSLSGRCVCSQAVFRAAGV